MQSMFSNCKSIESINLSSFNTEKVEDISEMFLNCESITSLGLTQFLFVYNFCYILLIGLIFFETLDYF